jgi:putative membrane protein
VICFMLMSEWPKEGNMGQAGWRRFAQSWSTTGMGLLTFLLSGLLGFILMYKSPVSVEVSFQNLMPAFVGLFTIPWLFMNLVCRVETPRQHMTVDRMDAGTVLRGSFAGGLGGGFAAFFPVVTGGVGGMLAGHATAMRDDRAFLLSQGASKCVYYAGGLLLLFVPGLELTRGGAAWIMKGLYVPHTWYDYYLALSALSLAGATCLFLVSPLTRGTIALINAVGYTRLSVMALAFVTGLVVVTTGFPGLVVMLAATGIGLIPILHGSRRMNCLGIILLPMACNMSGFGTTVAKLIHLL